jgi:predicted ATPase
MKSFLGLLLNILVSSYLFVFVDESEAFLHPPQARLLGRMLGEDKGAHNQVFIATHDSDVLTGLLDSSA